jgi:ribosomal protein L16 Arg81 hydroxylase
MIYLPPNVAHHGISLSDSISYSIGFKSIRYNELLETIVKNDLLIGESLSFHDAKNKVIQDRFEIPEYVVKDIQTQLLKTLSNTELIQNAIATHLSKPKNLIWDVQEFDEVKLKKLLKTKKLNRDVWAKLVSIKLNSNKVQMTINKVSLESTSANYKKIRAYFELSPYKEFRISKIDLENKFIFNFFIECLRTGIFFIAD